MHSISHWLKQIPRTLPNALKQIRIPAACGLCTQIHTGQNAICRPCIEHLRPISNGCQFCGLPLPHCHLMTCGQCIQKKPWLDFTFAPFIFDELLRQVLHEFKYRQGLYLTSFLAHLILDNLPKSALETDCLIPVPSHRSRLQQRGFNQAAELTKFIGKALNIPYELQQCKKIIHTPAQAQSNASQRKSNLQNAFQVRHLQHQRITIIDDLFTTGSTANELAKTLKNQGATHVSLWVCARVVEEKRA